MPQTYMRKSGPVAAGTSSPVEVSRTRTGTPAWLTDYVLGDHEDFGSARPAAVAGWPSVTVPAGHVSGLPVGVTLTGPRWSEPRLIAFAYAFEQATAARRQPTLAPSVTAGAAFGPRA